MVCSISSCVRVARRQRLSHSWRGGGASAVPGRGVGKLWGARLNALLLFAALHFALRCEAALTLGGRAADLPRGTRGAQQRVCSRTFGLSSSFFISACPSVTEATICRTSGVP